MSEGWVITEEKGVPYAKEALGHKSDRSIWRYVQAESEGFVREGGWSV